MRVRLFALAWAVLLSGCTVGPDYARPELDLPETFRFEEREARDLANTAWWTQFRDPVLAELIRIALVENKDLRIATARIEEFAGRFRSTRADLFPQIGYSVSATGQRTSEVGPVPLSPGLDNPESLYESLFIVTWELDVWGRIRRLSEAARAELLASESRERLATQARQIDALRHYARLARLRFEGGYTSYLEVLDAERSLFNAELSHAQTQNDVIQALINTYKAMGGGG